MYKFPVLALLALISAVSPVMAQEDTRLSTRPESADSVTPAKIPYGIHNDDDRRSNDHDADDVDDDDETLFTWGVAATLTGIDTDEITVEHEAFLEDALAFTFSKVHKNTDKKSLSSHLVAMEQPDPDGGLRGSLGVRRTIPSIWRYWGSYSCRFCAPDRLLSTDTPEGLEFSRMQERWELAFCRLLRRSGYAALADVDQCHFRMTHNGRDRDPEFVTPVAEVVVAEE